MTVALPGDFGKPRPALVLQAGRFVDVPTLTVLPISGTLVEAPMIRVNVEPNTTNGLRKRSQVMVDKAATIRRDKIGPAFGRLDDEAMLAVSRSLALFLGFG